MRTATSATVTTVRARPIRPVRPLWMAVGVLMFALAGALLSARAQAQTAGQMAVFCGPYRHALRLAPRGSASPVVEAPGANAQSDFCWGAFATLQSFATLQQAGAIQLAVTGRPKQRLCIPVTVERLQMVKAFLQYMDQHREMSSTDFGVAVLAAMFQAFPCAPGG